MSGVEQRELQLDIEDAPRLSAVAIGVGTAIHDIFQLQDPAVRRELIGPLSDTLTTTEAISAGLSAEQARELADSLEDNVHRLREYADTQEKADRAPVHKGRSGDFDY
jgi:hypothetical protein